MGLVGKRIEQTVKYIDPSDPKPPSLNYEEVFPITTFDAVREDMNDEDSQTLRELIDKIHLELNNKQPIFKGRPANYLMTFAGEAGEVGGIEISRAIPWDTNKQSHERIPTEKAVGDLMFKLGLVDENGNIIDNDGNHVRWSDVIGRPILYETTGMNEDGFITQKGTTLALNDIRKEFATSSEDTNNIINQIQKMIQDHLNDKDNPHDITLSRIGAASATAFDHHLAETNPHNIDKNIIGLGNVNNTSDLDKPISNATQQALDAINNLINNMSDDVGGLNYITNAEYDIETGIFKVTYRDKSTIELSIPIRGLVDEIRFDYDSKELVVTELSGNEKRLSLKDLFIRYIGSTSANISVTIEGDQTFGNQIIHAVIEEESITDKELADDAVITRIIADDSITTNKIKDLAITTNKLSDNSVTTDKIDRFALVNRHYSDRSVDGRTLFSSKLDNRVLAVLPKGSDPVWSEVTALMLGDNSVTSRAIANSAVDTSHINDGAVTTNKIEDKSINEDKIVDSSLTGKVFKDNSIQSSKLEKDAILPGTPSVDIPPKSDASGSEIASARWVLDRLAGYVNNHENIGKRVVDGSNLFSTTNNNRALVVYEHDTNPVWGLINNDMMDKDSISTKNLKNDSITSEKIHDKSIDSRHYVNESIKESHIAESAVTMEKISSTDNANMVLAVLKENSHPQYTKIIEDMMDINSINTKQIKDGAVIPAKIQSSDESNRVMAVTLRGTNPRWTQITDQMIGTRAVQARSLFSSNLDDTVLTVSHANDDPAYTKINGNMILSNSIKSNHIQDGAIESRHLHDNVISSDNIGNGAIKNRHLSARCVTSKELFTSPEANRVLAVGEAPYMDPDWTQVKTDMIADDAVTGDKLFKSKIPNKVLAATQAGTAPEYISITGDFFTDKSITGTKIIENVALQGNPTITSHPAPNADNFQMADTAWVRYTINQVLSSFNLVYSTWVNERVALVIKKINAINERYRMISNESIANAITSAFNAALNGDNIGDIDLGFDNNPGPDDEPYGDDSLVDTDIPVGEIPSIPNITTGPGAVNSGDGLSHLLPTILPSQSITTKHLEDHSVDGTKLFTSKYDGPRVIGVTKKGEDAEYILIEEDLIVDGAVTNNKIQRDVHLLGQPQIEIRPDPTVCDANGNGELIPDCQWVLDRIAENGGGNGSTTSSTPATITNGSIKTEYIMKRAVDGSKLFTSTQPNKILAVLESNSDPIYTTINAKMLDDKIIDGTKMVSSEEDNRVLGVKKAGDDPSYITINHEMLEDEVIKTNNIFDNAVTTDKIMNGAINKDKLAKEAIFDSSMLEDRCITNPKIADDAVTTEKIMDESITNEKLAKDIHLKGVPTVDENPLDVRTLRNIIISPDKPSTDKVGAKNGDIWFQYI